MHKETRAYMLMLLLPIIWGGNFVFGKVLVETMPPWTLAAFRWTLALIVLLALALYKEGFEKLKHSFIHWKLISVTAVTGVTIFNSVVYASLQYTSSVNAALVGTASPVVIAILSRIFLKERLDLKQIFGLVISGFGVIWVLSKGSISTFLQFDFNFGDLLMFFNIFVWGIYSISVKKATKVMSPIMVTTVTTLVGTLFLYPIALIELQTRTITSFGWSQVFGGLYLGILASVLAFILWNEGTKVLGPSRAGVFLNLIPVFAALEGFLFFGNEVTSTQILGGAVVLLGVYLATTKTQAALKLNQA